MNSNHSEQIDDHIKKMFTIKKLLGKGSYGYVFQAIDNVTNEQVAIKKIFGAFRNSTDAQRTFREVCFLHQLSNHNNIIRLRKVIKSQNPNDLYLIFDFMNADLSMAIQMKVLQPIHYQYIIYQIVVALKYIHSGGLIHRDLKPSNILINKQSIIKLSDFGLARSVDDLDETIQIMTENVATKSYNAPEILFGSSNYSYPVDMWSVGCILWEMINNQVLFKRENQDQIKTIINFLGIPNDNDILSFQTQNYNKIKEYLSLISKDKRIKPNKNFDPINPQDPLAQAYDFIYKCLRYNPNKRMTAEEALEHPYLLFMRKMCKEQNSDVQFITLKNDNIKYSVQEYKDILDDFLNYKDGGIQQYRQRMKSQLIKPLHQDNQSVCQDQQQITENQYGPHMKISSVQIGQYQKLSLFEPLNNKKRVITIQENDNNQFNQSSVKHPQQSMKNVQSRRLSLQTQYSYSLNQSPKYINQKFQFHNFDYQQ